MSAALAHRGPDGESGWSDKDAGFGLIHRRSASPDKATAAQQPVASPGGRYVLAQDGTIFNHAALRKQLEAAGTVFRGQSDAEVVVAAIEAWGLMQTLPRLEGAFAFALWDRKERLLRLARDAAGVRPLFCGQAGGGFLFGSELRPLRAVPGFQPEIDRPALALFLRHGYIPAPHCIYRGLRKVLPGTVLEVRWDPAAHAPRSSEQVFWSSKQTVEQGVRMLLQVGEEETVNALDALVKEVVKGQTATEGTTGVLLSGGVASSMLASALQQQSGKPIKTFSVGFRDSPLDEGERARTVATHLGTDHTDISLGDQECLQALPRLARVWDEPLADPGQLPTLLIADLAKKHMAAALTGEGADTLFGGHPRYLSEQLLWKTVAKLTPDLRRVMVRLVQTLEPRTWTRWLQRFSPVLPGALTRDDPGERLYRSAELLLQQKEETLYWLLVSHWRDTSGLIQGGAQEPSTALTDPAAWPKVPEFAQHMMQLDSVTYLPDSALAKVDRASAATGLELRAPLVDPRVAEWSSRVPVNQKLAGGVGRLLLRRMLRRYLPPKLIEAPGRRFELPLAAWLRRPLASWATSLIDEQRLRREGLLEFAPIQLKWEEHRSGARDWSRQLWIVLSFQAWLEDARTKR
jgi:asparagine synthase (glutamine-hydrolysing)